MKIITHTPRSGEAVYIQVKDFLYLGRTTGDSTYIDEYIDLLNSQKTDYDFIRIYDEEKRSVVSRTDIVDFKELYKESSMLLSKTLINLSFSSLNDEKSKQKSEDIRDVLAFRRGDLTYTIPLFSDGDVNILSEDGYLSFTSTIIPDCFVLRTADYSAIKLCECQDFLSKCLNELQNNYGEEIRNGYQIIESNNMIIIKVKNKIKENNLLSSFKKVKNRILKNEE